eukprot:94429-Amphidinium_carterae.1
MALAGDATLCRGGRIFCHLAKDQVWLYLSGAHEIWTWAGYEWSCAAEAITYRKDVHQEARNNSDRVARQLPYRTSLS